MPHAHLSAQWRAEVPPLITNRRVARVSNGIARVGDWVRELPAQHHIQPCACVLCRPTPEQDRMVQVLGIGERDGTMYLLLDEGYECPADEVERVQPNGHARAQSSPLLA
jgi:hypothetical protein